MKQVGNLTNKRIWVTRDYDAFKKLKGNRDVSVQRKRQIVDSIRTYGYHTAPLLVNEKMAVIDGQGRLAALKELNLPVEYIVEEGIGIEECRAMNIINSKWKMPDFIKSYADSGFKPYVLLNEAMSRYPNLGFDAVNYVFTGKASHDSKLIKSGKLKISDEAIDTADDVLQYMDKFSPIKNKVKGIAALLFIAVGFCYDVDGIDNKRLFEKVFSNIETMMPFNNIHECFDSLEKIYCRRLRNSQIIDFDAAYKEALAGKYPWYMKKWGNNY